MIRSRRLFARAQKVIPGGVNSPVRGFGAVGGTPVFMQKGKGARIFDADGRSYIDYVMSWGPLILGHAYSAVTRAVRGTSANGTTFGAATEGEVALAEQLCKAIPTVARVRLVNSGTEAAMSALRVARAYSKRPGLIKFAGGYHGHADPFLVRAGSGLATLGISSSAGVPSEVARRTTVLPYNDPTALRETIYKKKNEIGALILEPVAANMGIVLPTPEFLDAVGKYSREVALIADEVITGFRLRFGTVQETLGLKPVLTVLGKIIGGGLPIGAFGGSKFAMSMVAPDGPVYQAGTLSGNPIAVAAGRATLDALRNNPKVYDQLDARAKLLQQGLGEAARRRKLEITINRAGSMLTLFFHPGPIHDYASASRSDTRQYGKFFHAMLARGIYLPPSQFEAWFLSAAHSEREIEETIRAADASFRLL